MLTESEIKRLRDVVANSTSPFASRDRLILDLLLGTGIRLGSLVGIEPEDVTFDEADMSNYGGDEFVLPLFQTLHQHPFRIRYYAVPLADGRSSLNTSNDAD